MIFIALFKDLITKFEIIISITFVINFTYEINFTLDVNFTLEVNNLDYSIKCYLGYYMVFMVAIILIKKYFSLMLQLSFSFSYFYYK